jgi:hypothetical protein
MKFLSTIHHHITSSINISVIDQNTNIFLKQRFDLSCHIKINSIIIQGVTKFCIANKISKIFMPAFRPCLNCCGDVQGCSHILAIEIANSIIFLSTCRKSSAELFVSWAEILKLEKFLRYLFFLKGPVHSEKNMQRGKSWSKVDHKKRESWAKDDQNV